MSRSNAAEGFCGFARLRELPPRCPEIPAAAGAYVVVRSSVNGPQFAERSIGGRFNGEDPTVPVEALRKKWVEGASVMYVGRASELRRRIDQYACFGRGEGIGHRGGRYIWQLQDARDLQVAWKLDPNFRGLEADLVAAFIAANGALPFANLNHPGALG